MFDASYMYIYASHFIVTIVFYEMDCFRDPCPEYDQCCERYTGPGAGHPDARHGGAHSAGASESGHGQPRREAGPVC